MDIVFLLIGFFLLFKEKLAWVLFTIILLTTDYLGIGINISEFPFIHNVSDAGLILYLALCFYILNKNKFKLLKTSLSNYIIIFYFFLLISFFVDLLINNIDFVSIIKTSRHWIFLSCIWFFNYIPRIEIRKLINYLFGATVIISIIMLFEFFTGIQILEQNYSTLMAKSGELFVRGSIPSIFVPFYLLLLLSNFFKFKFKFKFFYVIIFLAVLITSVIRSWFLAIVFGIFLIFVLQNKKQFNNFFKGIIVVIGMFLLVFTNPIINERFVTGFEEIQNFSLTSNEIKGNYSFRILHARERLNYITSGFQHTIFGLGNISEENFSEVFEIGLLEESGRITQLDTGDIAWSIFFIRLGLLGTILYLFIFVRLLLNFYRIRKHNSLARVTFVYLLVNISIMSFASSSMATGQFFLLPILLYFLCKKELIQLKVRNGRF